MTWYLSEFKVWSRVWDHDKQLHEDNAQGDYLKTLFLPSAQPSIHPLQKFLIRVTTPDSPSQMVGANSWVYAVVEPVRPEVVAKKLRLEAFFTAQEMAEHFEHEVQNLKTVESGSLYVTSGQEDSSGDYWIIINKVAGSPLTEIDPIGYQTILSGPKNKCEAFLNARYNDLIQAVLSIERNTGLVHRNPNNCHALWTSLTQFSGFIGFGTMFVYGSEEWFRVLEEEFVDGHPLPDTTTLEEWLEVAVRKNWPLNSCVGS